MAIIWNPAIYNNSAFLHVYKRSHEDQYSFDLCKQCENTN